MITFHGLDRESWSWLVARTPVVYTEETTGIVARNEKGEIQAVCVFDSWTKTCVTVSFAIDNPMVIRHGFFNEIANFVFGTADRTYMLGLVDSDNAKALKADKHIGFHIEHTIKDGRDIGTDIHIMKMHRDDCIYFTKPRNVANG